MKARAGRLFRERRTPALQGRPPHGGRREEFRSEEGNQRLDQFLAGRIRNLSRSHLKGLIARGCVKVGGAVKSPDYRLRPGEIVEINYPEPPASPGRLSDWIIHEDRHLMILNKPAGLLMHPLGSSWLADSDAALSDPQANLAAILLRDAESFSRKVPRCGIVHRLDRQTSGVLLVAKTPQAYESLISAFKARTVSKLYWAIVLGVPRSRSTVVEAPVGRIQGHRKVKVTPFGKTSSTGFTVKDSTLRCALVEARPITGRTHQIRAHLAHLGHPVLGDPEFGTDSFDPKAPRLMLHARRIDVAHPGTGRRQAFEAPVPADFKGYWERLKRLDRSGRSR